MGDNILWVSVIRREHDLYNYGRVFFFSFILDGSVWDSTFTFGLSLVGTKSRIEGTDRRYRPIHTSTIRTVQTHKQIPEIITLPFVTYSPLFTKNRFLSWKGEPFRGLSTVSKKEGRRSPIRDVQRQRKLCSVSLLITLPSVPFSFWLDPKVKVFGLKINISFLRLHCQRQNMGTNK